MDLRVTISPHHPPLVEEPVVAFGQFEGSCAGLAIYAPGPGASALSRLYVDLISGRPLPLTFLTRVIDSLETIVAASLFLDRELCLHPKAAGLVYSVELATHLQEGGLAHVDRDLARLFEHVTAYMMTGYLQPAPQHRTADLGRRLQRVVEWLSRYVQLGSLPSLPRAEDIPKVLDRGTNGFVLAEVPCRPFTRMVDAVTDLYREGHLRGVVFSRNGTVERVLAFKKSPYVRFDLERAAAHLNAAEASLGQPEGWKLDRFLLSSTGTIISRDDLIQTFLRV